MKFFASRCLWSALCLGLAGWGPAGAQTLHLSNKLDTGAKNAGAAGDARTADYVVALVNSEPVTNNEVRQRLLRVEQQLTQQSLNMPPRAELVRQVMEQLISERAQLQSAVEQGLRVDEAALEDAERSIAARNQLDVAEFHRRVIAQGMDLKRYQNELRNQLLLRKLHDQEVERVRVSNADVERRIQELNGDSAANTEFNLSHVLIKVPERADAQAVKDLQVKAQTVADRARADGDFAALAREYSDAPEGAAGGSFNWRAASQLPALFTQAVTGLPVGAVAGPLRSPAGWHVLKVVDVRRGVAPELMLQQTHASHILLRLSAALSADAAVARLATVRDQITTGKTTFEAAARQFSQDGSASQGGDLGWALPGQFVPEFEEVMNALKPGEISPPTVTRFGVHLIRLDERRAVPMTPEQQSAAVRNLLREQKADEALQSWAEDVRSRTYVEYREPPRP